MSVEQIKNLNPTELLAGNSEDVLVARSGADLRDANLIDSVLGNAGPFTAGKSDYWFYCQFNDITNVPATFACFTMPLSAYGVIATGTRDLGIDTRGVIQQSSVRNMSFKQDLSNQTTVDARDGSLKPIGY